MTRADRAIAALREAADAVEALPGGLRRVAPLFGGLYVDPVRLRDEADWIEGVVATVREADQL